MVTRFGCHLLGFGGARVLGCGELVLEGEPVVGGGGWGGGLRESAVGTETNWELWWVARVYLHTLPGEHGPGSLGDSTEAGCSHGFLIRLCLFFHLLPLVGFSWARAAQNVLQTCESCCVCLNI